MKWILIFLCFPAFGQLPILPFAAPNTQNFSPVAGAIFWYSVLNNVTNAAGASPPSDNDLVKAWGDLSANGYHLQQLAGARQPTYHTSATAQSVLPPNSSPMIVFTNTVSLMTNTFSGTTYAQPNTFFFVINRAGRNGGAILNGQADQNQQIQVTSPPGGDGMNAGSNRSGPSYAAENAWRVMTYQFNQASSLLRSNGVNQTLSGTTVGTGGLKGITLGAFFNDAQNCNVQMAEVVGYNSALSTAQMLQEEEYLANKYGITGVP